MEDKRTWDCVKKPFQLIVTQVIAHNDNCLIGLSSFIPPPLPLPLNPLSNIAVAKKSTHFYPFCSKFNFV